MAEGHVSRGQNLLLNALDVDQHGPLQGLELLPLGLRHQVYEVNLPIEHVYFPVDCVISILAQLEDGVEIELATVGNEGMVGLPLFLGSDTTPGRAFAQVSGEAYRLPAADFKALLRPLSPLTPLLHRYTQALMVQISQGAACNRVHSNEQRCARWLLQTHDRVGKDEFPLTQEFLGQMLGVRRATVSEVASKLQGQNLIRYVRGVITVVDRAGLEAVSCCCYEVIRKEYDAMYDQVQLSLK